MEKEDYKKIVAVTIFAIAMGFLEAVVVIYLRKLYYPFGFSFPLKGFIEPSILNIEWVREFFAIVMLAGIGYLVGKKFYEKLAYFLLGFAVWDIFYYIWLKIALNWPSSFLTWDLLFLIPFPWIGPVLAPIIVSLSMIALAVVLINNKNAKIKLYHWLMLVAGSLLILYTFLVDYWKLIVNGGFLKDFFNLAVNPKFNEIISSYIPASYNWGIFVLGQAIILAAIIWIYLRNKKA